MQYLFIEKSAILISLHLKVPLNYAVERKYRKVSTLC